MTYHILTFVAVVFIGLGIPKNNKITALDSGKTMSKTDSFGLNGITFEQDVLPANKKTAKKIKKTSKILFPQILSCGAKKSKE
jgi:hypothetical protein